MEHYATAQQVFAAGLIFARLGTMVMLMPAIGENFVPIRIRLAFSFALMLMLFPILSAAIPTLPTTVSGVAGAVIKEFAIGLLIGSVLRFFMSSLASAGEVISIQSTLGFAQTANPTQAAPSTTLATFLGLMGLVLILTTNLHHMFISRSFALGLQLAAPIVAFSLIFNIATGLVGRVMPQFQIFFVASPLMVLAALSIFALSLGVIGVVWTDHYRELLAVFT